MTVAGWLELLREDMTELYVWAAYAVALALTLVELAAVALRGRTILGHLGRTEYPRTSRHRLASTAQVEGGAAPEIGG